MTVDGAALVAAAVKAAVQARAPRRTVQAVAAAVTGVLLARQETAAAPGPVAVAPPDTQGATRLNGSGDASPEALLQALRAARSAQRQRKKQRRKANKEAARLATTEDARTDDVVQNNLDSSQGVGSQLEVLATNRFTRRRDTSISPAKVPPEKKCRNEDIDDNDNVPQHSDAESNLTFFTDDEHNVKGKLMPAPRQVPASASGSHAGLKVKKAGKKRR